MADTVFFLEQALACSRAAEESPLPKLREKYRAAQIAWESLASAERAKEQFACANGTTTTVGMPDGG
jgi:hypothetical protein